MADKSTGPRSPDGKTVSGMNEFSVGVRPAMRYLARVLCQQWNYLGELVPSNSGSNQIVGGRIPNQGKKMREIHDIYAITSTDLKKLLVEFGLDDKLESGQIICPDSGDVLSWDNLGTVRIEGGRPVLYSALAAPSKFENGGSE